MPYRVDLNTFALRLLFYEDTELRGLRPPPSAHIYIAGKYYSRKQRTRGTPLFIMTGDRTSRKNTKTHIQINIIIPESTQKRNNNLRNNNSRRKSKFKSNS